MSQFKRKRLAAGLTMRALAEKLDVSYSTIQRWEHGKCLPEPEYFPKLAEAFSITSEEVTFIFAPLNKPVEAVA